MENESRYHYRNYRYSSAAVAAIIRRQDGLKRCGRCEQTKPLDQYHSDKSRVDGLYPYCLACSATLREQRRAKRQAADRARYAAKKSANSQNG